MLSRSFYTAIAGYTLAKLLFNQQLISPLNHICCMWSYNRVGNSWLHAGKAVIQPTANQSLEQHMLWSYNRAIAGYVLAKLFYNSICPWTNGDILKTLSLVTTCM